MCTVLNIRSVTCVSAVDCGSSFKSMGKHHHHHNIKSITRKMLVPEIPIVSTEEHWSCCWNSQRLSKTSNLWKLCQQWWFPSSSLLPPCPCRSAHLLSRYRPRCPIIAVTRTPQVQSAPMSWIIKMSLCWLAVHFVLSETCLNCWWLTHFKTEQRAMLSGFTLAVSLRFNKWHFMGVYCCFRELSAELKHVSNWFRVGHYHLWV